MEQQKLILEVVAPTLEEAIEKGLDQLGLPRDAVEVQVLDEKHQGFLGLGEPQVRVRLTVISQDDEVVSSPQLPEDQEKHVGKGEGALSTNPEDMDEIEKNKETTIAIVKQLLDSMKIDAQVSGRMVEPEDDKDYSILLVEVTGKDLSILIGRRSETLNALQYITSLILSEKTGQWIPLMIDVQGYRFRRERQLRQLARRLADQVVQTGRKQVLESMPANERRIIHLELRYHPFVTTESVGEEPNRRTTIILKPK